MTRLIDYFLDNNILLYYCARKAGSDAEKQIFSVNGVHCFIFFFLIGNKQTNNNFQLASIFLSSSWRFFTHLHIYIYKHSGYSIQHTTPACSFLLKPNGILMFSFSFSYATMMMMMM
mmetsp:Transcript_1628/g.2329  ORF Transcript_1628/g.2329 Transcript_1628/m.2329 type:complete len:117 (-) Transcript_1628:53-403(-)